MVGSARGWRALILNGALASAVFMLAMQLDAGGTAGPRGLPAVALMVTLLAGILLMDATRVSWGSDRAGQAVRASAVKALLLPSAVLLPAPMLFAVGVASSVVFLAGSLRWVGVLGNAAIRVAGLSAAAVVFGLLAPHPALDLHSWQSVGAVLAAGLAMASLEDIMLTHLVRGWDGLDEHEMLLLLVPHLLPDVPEVLLGALICLLYPSPTTWVAVGLIAWAHAAVRQHALARAASRDLKTGLLSWPAFEDLAEAALRRSMRTNCPVALMLMDLDGLKAINTEHGHLAGDQYIATMAGLLARSARDYDILARFGGDEFCLLLPDTSLSDGRAVAERIRALVEATWVGEVGAPMSVSMGLAVPSGTDDVASLVRAADVALRRAKAEGRNRLVIASGPHGSLPRQAAT